MDGNVAFPQEQCGPFHAGFRQQRGKGLSCMFFQQTAEILGVEMKGTGTGFQRDLCAVSADMAGDPGNAGKTFHIAVRVLHRCLMPLQQLSQEGNQRAVQDIFIVGELVFLLGKHFQDHGYKLAILPGTEQQIFFVGAGIYDLIEKFRKNAGVFQKRGKGLRKGGGSQQNVQDHRLPVRRDGVDDPGGE